MNTPLRIAYNLLFALAIAVLLWATVNVHLGFGVVLLVYGFLFFPEKEEPETIEHITTTTTGSRSVMVSFEPKRQTRGRNKTKKQNKRRSR